MQVQRDIATVLQPPDVKGRHSLSFVLQLCSDVVPQVYSIIQEVVSKIWVPRARGVTFWMVWLNRKHFIVAGVLLQAMQVVWMIALMIVEVLLFTNPQS